jgi:hypothetical protein
MPYYNSYQQSYAPFQPNYQQSYAQPQIQTPMQTPINPQNTGIIWVQGEIGARAYPVASGNSVLLMDSEGQNFFIKSADMSGMPTMKKYSYSEVVEEPMKLESHDNRDYDTAKLASRDEVKKLQEEIDRLKQQLSTMESLNTQNKAGGKQNG